MKIGLQTWGSHGDVAPFIALAGGFSAAGHEVTLAVTTDAGIDYAHHASRLGFELVRVHPFAAHAPPEELRRIVDEADPIAEVRLLNRYYFDPIVEELFAAAKDLCAQSDVVLGHFWLHPLLTASQLLDVPRVAVHLCPIGVRSRHVAAAGPNLGPLLNGLVWNLGDYLTGRAVFRSANAIREREGLAPVGSLQRELFISDTLTLITASPLLCPNPPDWGDNIQITGQLRSNTDARRGSFPASLREFIEAGEPPVFMSFGSCDVFYGPENVELFVAAARLAGVRAIVQCGDVAASAHHASDRIHLIEESDHAEVFPGCRMIVHHGGAGTTQSALGAGRPAVVVEHGFDQAYWGKALVRAGISPRLLHRRSVTPRKLARAIRACVDDPQFGATASRLAVAFNREDGVRRAVELVEGVWGEFGDSDLNSAMPN